MFAAWIDLFWKCVRLTAHLLIFAVLLVVLIAIVLGCVWTYRNGYIDAMIPKPRVIEPVRISLVGPSIAVRGTTADFFVDIHGKAGVPKWQVISPPGIDFRFRPTPDGRRAEFSSFEEATFQIYVSVSGEGMQGDSAHMTFENLNLTQEEPPAPPQQAQQPQQTQQAMAMPPPPPQKPGVAELTMGALTQVDSDDKAAEARSIAGSIRGVIGQIQSGLGVTPTSDPAIMVAQRVEAQLQERARKWDQFIISIGVILKYQREEGNITSLPTAIPALNEIANVLYHVQ